MSSQCILSYSMIGEDLVTVLDQLRIKYVIGIGDGAGSNIIVRFGMMHVTRCLGVILLNPTTNKVTMMDNLKDRFQNKELRIQLSTVKSSRS